ncbi:MAG: hypothetical protein KDD70_09960, partial [Bdellovibrionales bacterium]|nr:hypothetical protein [Bdellovibrionales bacterium]
MQGSPIGPHQAKFVLNGEEYSRSLESLIENIHSILGETSTRTSSREGSLLEAVESFSQSIAKVSEGLERVLDSRLVLYMNGDQRSAIDALIGDVRSLQQFMGELTQDAVPSILSEAILQLGSQCLHSLHRIPSEWITRSRRELDQIAAASDELQEFTGDQLLQELKRDALGITSSQSALGEVRGKAVPKWDDSKFFSGEVSLLSAVLLGLQKERKRNFGTIITRNPSRVYESLPIDGLVVAEPGADGMMVSSLERFLQRDCGGEGIQVQTYPHIDELPPLERDDVYIAIDRKDLMSHDGRVCLPMPRGYRVVAISLIDGGGEKIPTNPQVLSALQLTASVSQELQFQKVEYVLAPVDDRPCYATL